VSIMASDCTHPWQGLLSGERWRLASRIGAAVELIDLAPPRSRRTGIRRQSSMLWPQTRSLDPAPASQIAQIQLASAMIVMEQESGPASSALNPFPFRCRSLLPDLLAPGGASPPSQERGSWRSAGEALRALRRGDGKFTITRVLTRVPAPMLPFFHGRSRFLTAHHFPAADLVRSYLRDIAGCPCSAMSRKITLAAMFKI